MRRSALILAFLVAACSSPPATLEQVAEPRELAAYPNPFMAPDPLWAPQPRRDNPLEIAVTPAGDRAYVSLQGSPDEPGHHVAVVSLDATPRVLTRIPVGAGPTGLAMHPDGRFLVAFNRLSNFVSVIDTARDVVAHSPGADFYAVEGVFTPDGRQLFFTNRWRDAVSIWDVEPGAEGLRITGRDEPGIAVGTNPRDIAISDDGQTVAAAALTGMMVSLIDRSTRAERRRIDVGAPANGLAFAGDWLIVATLSASTHHQPLVGPDTNHDGQPGDGTPNVNFQDLQNEIAIYDLNGDAVARYTSDTLCCQDFRDVDPLDVARHGDLLPPEDTWLVGGALPEQLAISGTDLYITYSASNQMQRFELDPATGLLAAGPVWGTGHNPHGIAIAGDRVLVAHRLGETLGVYDRETGASEADVVVGDVSGGDFPATDAEIGELFNFVTAPFTVDGDQSCAHCHREGGNIDKAFSMPLTRYGGVGSRMTMAYRGAADSRPWFFEAAMDETNFTPVMNEFARIENFCCTDYTLWPDGPPAGCATDPPAECSQEPNAGSPDGFGASRGSTAGPPHPRPTAHATRDGFYLNVAKQVMGRQNSFGDGVYFEDVITEERRPVPLDFNGITRALGLFLLQEPGLLPNPNVLTASARRGQALFESDATGCAACHPAPSFSVSTDHNPAGLPLLMGPVVTPNRSEDGINLDLPADGFMSIFPRVVTDTCEAICGAEACDADPDACDDLRNANFGVPPLRGIWDRASGMLHDGRANGLLEVLATPGHPALASGQTGFNVSDGVPDSHGSTSHLTPAELADLITFLRTL